MALAVEMKLNFFLEFDKGQIDLILYFAIAINLGLAIRKKYCIMFVEATCLIIIYVKTPLKENGIQDTKLYI